MNPLTGGCPLLGARAILNPLFGFSSVSHARDNAGGMIPVCPGWTHRPPKRELLQRRK